VKSLPLLHVIGFLLFTVPGQSQDLPAQPTHVPVGTSESFAHGLVKGHWQLYKSWDNETGTYGHRGDLSLYNPLTNKVYVVTSGKNLVMGDLAGEGHLDLQNQKVYLKGRVFLGLNKPDGTFRLISGLSLSPDLSNLHYSDDNGMTWKESFGGWFKDNESIWGTVLKPLQNRILVLVKKAEFVNGIWSSRYVLMQSDDLGTSYREVISWPGQQFKTVIAGRPLNSDQCYLIAKPLEKKQWIIYQYDNALSEITRFEPDTAGQIPVAFCSTRIGDTDHFYLATSKNDLYHSSDHGRSWEKRGNDPKWKQLYTANPQDSNKIYCKTTHLHLSVDGGKTITELPYWWAEFGWDVKTANWFQKKDGSWFMILCNDFGTFFAKDPHDRSTWKNMNQGNIHQMNHHGASWDKTDLLITGNQDRGSMSWRKAGTDSLLGRTVMKADGLRICISNRGTAYWFIHYWPTIYHRHAPVTGDPRLAEFPLKNRTRKTWYTPPMKPSQVPGEDAIYLTGEPKLIKLTYLSDSNKIIQKQLGFDFKAASGDVTYGIETVHLDTNRMYVVTKNGHFYYTRDGGKHWSQTAHTGKVPSSEQRRTWGLTGFAVEAAELNPDLVFWSGQGGKGHTPFLISEDGGVTFREATKGLPPDTRIDDIAVTDDGALVFGTNGFVYVKAEDRWYDMKGDSYPLGGNVNGVDWLARSGIVRFYTYGLGVMDFVLEQPVRGVLVRYYDNQNLKGQPVSFSKSCGMTLDCKAYSPIPGILGINHFGISWNGNLQAPVSGNYTFTVQATDGVKLRLDRKLLINNWQEQDSVSHSASIKLDSGRIYPIRLDYFNGRGEALMKLFWSWPGQPMQLIPPQSFVPGHSSFLPKFQYFPEDFTVITMQPDTLVSWREPSLIHPDPQIKITRNPAPGTPFTRGITTVTYIATPPALPGIQKSFDVAVYQASRLKASYFKDTIPGKHLILSRYEPCINYEWKREIPGSDPLIKDTFAIRWEGQVIAPVSGDYRFSIRGDNGTRLFLNDSLVIDGWKGYSGKWITFKQSFEKGTPVNIRMDYHHTNDFIVAKLYWKIPGTRYQLIRFRE